MESKVNELKVLIVLVTALGGLIGLWLAWYAWRRRDVVSARWFAAFIGVTGTWALGQAIFYLSPNPAVAQVLYDVTSLVAIPIPVLFLVWAATFTGSDEWLTRPVQLLLGLEIAGYTLLYATKSVHGLIETPVRLVTKGGVTLPAVSFGGLENVQLVISILFVLAGFGLLIRYYLGARTIFRRQAGVIIVGTTFPILGIVVLATGFSPHPGLDTTALSIIVEGIIISWALFRYDFLEVAPIASDLLVEELPDPVFVLDQENRVVDYNPAAVGLLSVGRSEELGMTDLPDDLLAAVEDGDLYERADPTAPGGTTTRVYEPITTPIVDHRDIHRGRLVMLRDVTMQEQRQRTLAELQDATRRFMTAQTPVEVAEDLVNTMHRLLGHAYSAMLEPTPAGGLRSMAVSAPVAEELDGDTLTIDPQYSPEPGELEEATVFQDVDAQSVVGWAVDVESILVLPVGDHGIVGIGSRAGEGGFSDEQRQFAGILTNAAETAMDRAEREAELRESRALLEGRNEQLEFFNGILRHDILNGLNIIEGNATLLEDHVDEAGLPTLRTIQNWSGDMSDLTKQIRSIVVTLQESAETDVGAEDLAAVLHEKVGKVRRTFEAVHITADVDDLPPVVANDLLGQVLENLLLNAVEHNESDEPHVEVTAEVDAETVRVRIADDGPGIPDDRKEAVFEPEYTSDASDTFGFGLYFVSTMVEAYGGEVHFEDSDMGGAAAVVTLRRADAD